MTAKQFLTDNKKLGHKDSKFLLDLNLTIQLKVLKNS